MANVTKPILLDETGQEIVQAIKNVAAAVLAGGGDGEGGGGVAFVTDDTLTLKDGVLGVNTAEKVEQDNTLPVTSAAVYTEVGNINALLETI